LPDDLIRPEQGHATIFAAYGEKGRAEQVIFHAELAPFFQRKDWKLNQTEPKSPLVVPAADNAALRRATEAQSPDGKPAAPAEAEPDLARNVAEGIAHTLGKDGQT
jgi:hypothetical protein